MGNTELTVQPTCREKVHAAIAAAGLSIKEDNYSSFFAINISGGQHAARFRRDFLGFPTEEDIEGFYCEFSKGDFFYTTSTADSTRELWELLKPHLDV